MLLHAIGKYIKKENIWVWRLKICLFLKMREKNPRVNENSTERRIFKMEKEHIKIDIIMSVFDCENFCFNKILLIATPKPQAIKS